MRDLRRCGWSLAVVLTVVSTAVHAQAAGPPAPLFDRARIDTTCSPCKDFFRFANGAWLDSVRIPPDRDAVGSYSVVADRNTVLIGTMLDSLAYAPGRHARTPVERNVGVFYRSCMDSSATGAQELEPLQPELRRIAAIRSPAALGAAIGRLNRYGMSPLFWFVIIGDYDDPTRIIGEIRGLYGWTMPSRQAYLTADSSSAKLRDAYVAMLTRVFTVLGDPADSAEANARRVLAVETAIARVQPRDSGAMNSPHSLADLRRLAPGFDWRAFAEGLGRPDLPPINMRPPSVVRAIDSLTTTIPLADWRAYLRWKYVFALAPGLRKPFGGAIGEFFNIARGRQSDPPRSKLCANVTTNFLGNAVGRAYVARAFSPEERKAANAMAESVRSALRDRLTTLDWMGPTTRARALAKVDSMLLWIGYSDQWDDDAGLTLKHGPGPATFLAFRSYQMDKQIARIGTRENVRRWTENFPALQDATYYPTKNALEVTAGLLQRPIFDARADIAANLAAAGFTIGHELTHGFDTSGRLFDETGRRQDWWAADDAREFTRRADLVADQYNQFIVVDSIRQNGRRTLGENIADIGGLTLAHLAFKRATAGRANEVVDGYTLEQRFFIAYAQATFGRATRPQALRLAAETDNHSAPQWRVNGPLMTLAAFAAAFGCKEGDRMFLPPERRGGIW